MDFNTKDDRDLLWGNDAYTADYLGISKKQVARYKAHPDKMPQTVRRLLMLRFGDLSGLLGQVLYLVLRMILCLTKGY